MTGTTKISMVYVFDAYCGWCYGFGPQLTGFLGKFQSSTATPLDQNIVFELAGVSGTSCVTSHYSTILPPSTRNIATIARPRSWGLLAKWTCR